MWFLTLEMWPYLGGALAIGLVTGWYAGCAPRPPKRPAEPAEKTP
ncbi:hypothetical protein [Ancylobacter mangrovi]|uniref:Uncharacterized protein n=1 Tax=Ancylobacter mangrovi TaxID=2972472 RepID=A0A9X2T3F0_9HYPH|nr:hypothetical protein [Ancylobacter mangrovi]MCS0497032.1 hypothetical protein [Ancylobacter mangrovi]MCS0503479.1 hypothetical protein [Ancylobacter mangrovi]